MLSLRRYHNRISVPAAAAEAAVNSHGLLPLPPQPPPLLQIETNCGGSNNNISSSNKNRNSPNKTVNSNMNKKSSNSNIAHSNSSDSACHCQRFLHPTPNGPSQDAPNPYLQHYCHVCNIQLNSCRQARIHVEGKKHIKRLHYLMLCWETSKDDFSSGPFEVIQAPPAPLASAAALSGLPLFSYPAQEQHQHQHQQAHSQHAYPPTNPYYYGQPPAAGTAATAPSYVPGGAPAPMPPLQPAQLQHQHQHQQQHLHAPPPQAMQSPAAAAATLATPTVAYGAYPMPFQDPYHQAPAPHVLLPGQVGLQQLQHPQQQMLQQHQPHLHHQHIMSPSLTSGFSGSGGDCKSTETSSILSAASYTSSSNLYRRQQVLVRGGGGGGGAVANIAPPLMNVNPCLPVFKAHDYDVIRTRMASSGRGPFEPNPHGDHPATQRLHPQSMRKTQSNPALRQFQQQLQPDRSQQQQQRRQCQQQRQQQQQQHGLNYPRNLPTLEAAAAAAAAEVAEHRPDCTEDSFSGLRCDVCQVSLNSSNQLHAHLLGQKHRVRVMRSSRAFPEAGRSSSGHQNQQPQPPVSGLMLPVSPRSSSPISSGHSDVSEESEFPASSSADAGATTMAATTPLAPAARPRAVLRRGSDVNVRPKLPQFRHRSLTQTSSGCRGGGQDGADEDSDQDDQQQQCLTGIPLSRYQSSSCLSGGSRQRHSTSQAALNLRKAVSQTALNVAGSLSLLSLSCCPTEERAGSFRGPCFPTNLSPSSAVTTNQNGSEFPLLTRDCFSDSEEDGHHVTEVLGTDGEFKKKGKNSKQRRDLLKTYLNSGHCSHCNQKFQDPKPRPKTSSRRRQASLSWKHQFRHQSLATSTGSLKEIPMLDVFLQRLPQPQQQFSSQHGDNSSSSLQKNKLSAPLSTAATDSGRGRSTELETDSEEAVKS